MKPFARSAVVVSCLALGAPAAWAQAAPAPASAAASVPATAIRADIANSINAAVDLHRAGQTAEALARVERAIADFPQPTPMERTQMQRIRGQLALQLQKFPEAVKALEAALAENMLAPPDQLAVEEALARASFQLKSYRAAVDWARKAQAHGSQWSGLRPMVVRALYLAEDYAATATELEAMQAAGTALGDDDLRILASAYAKTRNDAAYARVVERLLRDHPRPEYWTDLLSRVPHQPGWQQRHDIDLYRLRLQVGAMEEAHDYVTLADLAAKAGLPAEAQAVLDAGYAKGVLGKGSGAAEQQSLRTRVVKQANEDKAALAAAAQRPPAAGDARAAGNALTTGAALVSVGQTERGLEFMKAALAGPLADPAQARLQYALALQRAGRNADAIEALRGLNDHQTLGLLSRLWVIALTQKKG